MYTPNPRRRSDSELRELRAGAKALRARARRNQAEDPAAAERDYRSAEQNDADIAAELARRNS